MTHGELVEAVARALCCDGAECPARSNFECNKWIFIEGSRAAIDVVVEECARVAEQPAADQDYWGYVTKYQTPPCIVDAIRALKQGDRDE